jgi:PAS domain S-box-containing protein
MFPPPPRRAPPGPPGLRGALAPLGLALLLLAPTALVAGAAQAQQHSTPIATVLADADGDLVPDAVGDTVVVAGRATVGSGQLHQNWTELFVQDATGGLRLAASSAAPHVAAGDSVVARGLLEHRAGMAQLTDPQYHVVPTTSHEPTAREVDLRDVSLEALEGQLVELRGTVVEEDTLAGVGAFLLLLSHDNLVQVFAYANRAEAIHFGQFDKGDYVRVQGIAAQHDLAEPYNGSYLVYPRNPGDVGRAGLPPSFYRNGLLGFGALLLGALGWAGALRRQVRKRVAELQDSEARYAHLFNAAGDAVLLHADDPNGWILEANAEAARAFGLPRAEFHRRSLRLLAVHEAGPAVERHLTTARLTGEARDTFFLRTSDGRDGGRAIPFEIRTHRIDLDGASVFLSLARDATARLAYEQALLGARFAAERAREEAEEMARLKSALLANMSHEIRTPLTAIIGFAEVLREEVPDEQQEYAKLIAHGGKRLLDTLNSVLDLARLDSGQERLRPEPLDVIEEVRSCARLLQPLVRAKGLALHLHADVQSLPACHDRAALGRVLHNLLGNAVKFTEEGEVRVVVRSTPDALTIQVSDTGIGIEAAFLPKLFTEFKQESEGHARSHEGTGLGLAISKRLVELMGGAITVASRKGIGTAFTVTLPRALPAADAPAGDGAAPAARLSAPVAA